MRTRPGQRDDVVAVLLGDTTALRQAGCLAYIVNVSDDDPELILVNEVWQSKKHHQASLELPETKAAIGKAMPMLTGEFTGREVTVRGGLGL